MENHGYTSYKKTTFLKLSLLLIGHFADLSWLNYLYQLCKQVVFVKTLYSTNGLMDVTIRGKRMGPHCIKITYMQYMYIHKLSIICNPSGHFVL